MNSGLEANVQGELQKQEINTDIEHEIACTRCRDIMILISGFDSLYYSPVGLFPRFTLEYLWLFTSLLAKQ